MSAGFEASDPQQPAGQHPGTWYPPPGYGQHPGTWYPPPPGNGLLPPHPESDQPPAGIGTGAPAGYSPPGYSPPGYLPPGWSGNPTSPAPAPRHGTTATRRGGAAGGALAALFGLVKAFLAFGKFGFTALTMLVAIFLYAQFFGWAFGVGIVVIIFIHEMGHFLTSRAMGVPMSAPVFVPFLGAFTAAGRGFQSSRLTEAVIAVAGPVFGFLATLGVFLWGLSQAVPFAFALSYFGFFITLFNLIPLVPLDGGRVASAISKWFNLAGLAIFGVILVSQIAGSTDFNPFLLLIFVVGAYSVWGRFRASRLGNEAPPLPVAARVLIGISYIALVAASALLMSVSNHWLVTQGVIQQV
ncbi:MAG TPA: site-2 protease family protein [Candidatus Binatia bacterium]|nr:site-2 protease family protein [Candidatus Binatia bacterium]